MAKQLTIPRAPVFVGPAAEARLHQLGISGAAPLLSSLNDGAGAARSTTSWHPRSYRGQRMWAETHASLGNNLAGGGWTPENYLGADMLVNARRGLAIIVTAADSSTGVESYNPQVRYERREVITFLVNGHADTLFFATERPEWEVWFLLHYLGQTSLQAELSKPTGIASGGWVASWDPRIILPDSLSRDPDRKRQFREPAKVDVPVDRRMA